MIAGEAKYFGRMWEWTIASVRGPATSRVGERTSNTETGYARKRIDATAHCVAFFAIRSRFGRFVGSTPTCRLVLPPAARMRAAHTLLETAGGDFEMQPLGSRGTKRTS